MATGIRSMKTERLPTKREASGIAAKRKIIRRATRADGYIQVLNEYNETELERRKKYGIWQNS